MQKSTINSHLPHIGSMPWWVSPGSQADHVNSSNVDQFHWAEEQQKSGGFGKSQHIMDQAPEKAKESVFQVAFSAGENKNAFKENNLQQIPQQHKGYIELGLGQPLVNVYANYPLGDQCHGLFTSYGTQPVGRVMLPFSVTTEEGPIYVNPKQYHGIMRRRKMRAKEGLKNKGNREKPYLHESRHRHACRRPRGAGGRFLNTKELETLKNEQEAKRTSDHPSSESSGSEVLQSESVNLNSSKEVSDSRSSNNRSGSEVSSMYYNKEFDCFGVNPARPFAFHPLSSMEGSRQGASWVAAPDGCCDFFKI